MDVEEQQRALVSSRPSDQHKRDEEEVRRIDGYANGNDCGYPKSSYMYHQIGVT